MLPLAHMTALLLLALLLGGLIGWERERHARPAGLRTHILVCVGATLITQVSHSFGANGDRIAAQIVTGVGFLGAGTILRDGTSGAVSGLTTAASLWAIAGVGIAIGYGGVYAELAAVATAIILFVLTLLNTFENTLIRQRRRHTLVVVFHADCDPLTAVRRLLDALNAKGARTRDLHLDRMANTETAKMQLTLSRSLQRDSVDVLLRADADILHYDWDE